MFSEKCMCDKWRHLEIKVKSNCQSSQLDLQHLLTTFKVDITNF